MDQPWKYDSYNKGNVWEPDADYDDLARDMDTNWKSPEPLQTIGDILFDQRELNPRTYAEYTQEAKTGEPNWDNVPGKRFSNAGHHEEDAEGNPKTFKRVLVRFAERTSMQGVPYIYVSSVWYAKLGWSLLFLVGFGMMLGHLYLLFDEFYEYDTHSTVTLGFSTLTFPAVTICNVNPIKQSKMYMATPELRALVDAVQPTNIAGSMEQERNKHTPPESGNQAGSGGSQPPTDNSQSQSGQPPEKPETGLTRRRRSLTEIHKEKIKRRYKRFIDGFSIEESNNRKVDDEDIGGLSGNKSTIRAIEDEFRFLYSTMAREERNEMGHAISDMLMECTFRGITCTAEQFRLLQTAQYGNCYTIENNRYISTVGGPDDGLTLYLFMEDEEYLHGITNSMGFQVHIHNIGEFPNPYSEGLSVSAGMETFIGLKKVNIERLKDPYGECVENEDFKSLYNITYTQRTCQAFCLQKKIVEECECFDAENDEIFKSLAEARMVPRPQGNASEGYNPCRNEAESACARLQVLQFQNQEVSCDCPSPCKESLYTKALSSKIWPTEEYAGILVEYLCSQVNETSCEAYKQKTRSEIATSFLKMVIYYEDLNYENITEEIDYETFQFVSDIGGTIGLWIGLSMISFFEVVQFLYEMAHYVFYMKPRLAREKARRQKLRQEKHDLAHALKFINTNGLLPMTSAASKLMGSGSGSGSAPRWTGQKSTPHLDATPREGAGSTKDSGTSGDSLSSGRGEHQLLAQGNERQAKTSNPWYSNTSGVHNPAFKGDQLPGLKDLSMMTSPSAYLSGGLSVDTRDLNVEFPSQKC